MATVTSLTKQRIEELAAGWGGVAARQDQLDTQVGDLANQHIATEAELRALADSVVPNLQSNLAENQIALDDLNENVLPALNESMVENAAVIEDMTTVTIPNIQADLASGIVNSLLQPKNFFQPDAPVDGDDEDRALQVGDVWYDTDDGYKQYMWNGVEWSTFTVDIPDLSITVQKFRTSTHMIY